MKVSCICPTWNRPGWLGEAVESFLRQDYRGEKELIILNDCPEQVLLFTHPEVKVYNVSTLFKTLSKKYNEIYFSGMITGDVVTPWEDDDIYLPHKISRAVGIMEKTGADYYKLSRAYFWNYGHIDDIADNLFFCAGFWTKELLDKTGGPDEHTNASHDQSLERKLKEKSKNYVLDTSQDAKDIYYIYRWGGIGVHVSGLPESSQAIPVYNKMKSENMQTGTIPIRARWDTDYIELARKFREGRGI